jgi:lambda family phage tail tape measure protein
VSKYSADIEIAVRGGQQLDQAIKTLNRLNNSINVVTRNAKLLEGKGFNVASIENYSRAVSKAERAVRKAAEGTDQERQAITRLVGAMELENKARERKNILIAREVANQRRVIATANAGVGVQGPAIPAYMRTGPSQPLRGSRSIPGSPAALAAGANAPRPSGGGSGGGRLGGAISGSIIGGSFPLLFGQGAGAAAGGAIGGLVGGLAGPGGSFAGSLLGTLLGDIASQGSKVKELAVDIGFSAEQTERLKNAFALAGQEADKFEAATQNIRGLGLSIDDQADAITLAANLVESYGGKIDKVAASYANFVEKGKVGITDINKFTSEGIPILDELEKKYNTNRDGILKLAKDGQISAQALSDALIAIGNSSDTAVKKTVSGWDKAWADIKAGGSLLGQAISAYFNAVVGSANSSTSSIAESFGSMFKNIVQNSIDATAALARNLANLARFAANVSATAELGGLNIGATVSKNIAKNVETTARNFDAALQKIQLPGPGKVGAITIPGQAPPAGAGAKDKGADTAEQRAKALLALSKEYLTDQLKLIELNVRQVELFVGTEAALTRQLELTQTVGRIRTESLELEREEALMEAAKLGTTGAVVKLYTQKFRLLQNELNIEQKVTEQKLAQTKLERQLRLDALQRDKQEAIRGLKVQQNNVGLDIAAFTTDPKLVEKARQQLDQINRAYEAEVPILTEIDTLQRQIQSGAYGEEDLAIKNKELALQQSKLNGIREELTLLDSLEQRQLRLQQFYQTYGQLIQSVSGEIANAVTFGVSEMIRGTKTAEEVFSQFLNAVGEALLSAAQQMIASYIAIGIAKMFAGFGGAGGGLGSSASNVAAYAPLAKGGTFGNGIATFANGGAFTNSIVNSPTMFKFADGGTTRTGLMGEAGPEAIMPLKRGPDGSLGVQANGLREAMGRPPGGANGSPVLNMSFQSTNINGVEYVSRDQLEAAMAQTRRQAAKEGANRGMNMTLDKIQNSPSTRSRVGIR